jgi:predicted small lipoprotein YifL
MNRMLLMFVVIAACLTACERHSASELPQAESATADKPETKVEGDSKTSPATPAPAATPTEVRNYQLESK